MQHAPSISLSSIFTYLKLLILLLFILLCRFMHSYIIQVACLNYVFSKLMYFFIVSINILNSMYYFIIFYYCRFHLFCIIISSKLYQPPSHLVSLYQPQFVGIDCLLSGHGYWLHQFSSLHYFNNYVVSVYSDWHIRT